MERAAALRRLQAIPNVGPQTAEDLWRLGIRRREDLRGQDPQAMYERLCRLKGLRIDRCQLYVFRSVVYYATRKAPRAELLKWWAWKDRTRI
jgi:hypothetical protein